MLAPQASSRGWVRHAWLLPAVLAAAAICLLCWGAWVYGYDPRWLAGSRAWWRPILQTDQDWTLVVTMALLLGGLGAYWWPRRRGRPLPIGLIAVVVLVLVAAVLGTVSYVPCRGQMSTTGIMFWILQLYVGQPPNIYQSVHAGGRLHGRAAARAATRADRRPRRDADRRARRRRRCCGGSRLTGCSPGSRATRPSSPASTPLTLPLLKRLAEAARSPRAIIVIEPDEDNPLLEEARLTGARVVIGDPASPRHPAADHLRLARLRAQPPLRARRQGRGERGGDRRGGADPQPLPARPRPPAAPGRAHRRPAGTPTTGAASAAAGRACGSRTRSARPSPPRAASSPRCCARSHGTCWCAVTARLTLAILLELARRAWEQSELVKAAATGRATEPAMPPPPDAPSPLPLDRVALLDLRSPDIRREYLASAPDAVLNSLPEVVAHPVRWRDHLLRTLDAMDPPRPARPPSSSRTSPPGSGVHEAGRVARLHPETPVFVLATSGDAMGGAIFDLLHPFEPGLLIEGDVPEDTWTRVARHWHECYRLSHPLPPGHPKAAARLPWSDLDPFLRQDNILAAPLDPDRGRGARPAVGAGPPGPAGQRHRAERGGPDGDHDRRAHPLAAAAARGRPGRRDRGPVGGTPAPACAATCPGTCAHSSRSWRTSASCRSSRPAARRRRPASSASGSSRPAS